MGRVPYLFTGEERPWARYRTCSPERSVSGQGSVPVHRRGASLGRVPYCSPERSVPGQGTVPVHRRGVSLGSVPYLFTREEGGHS